MGYLRRRMFSVMIIIISVLSVIVRTVELAVNIDEKAIFYLNEKSIGRYIFIGLLGFGFLYSLGYAFKLYQKRKFDVDPKFRLKYFFCNRILLIIVSIGFAVDVFYEIYRISNPIYDISLPYNTAFFSVIIVLLTVASLIFFMALSFVPENKLLSISIYWIIPVIWAVLRTIRDFVSFPVIVTISKNSLDIIYLCALIATTFSLSRIFTSSESKNGYAIFTIFAPITIILGFVLSLPPLIALIFSFSGANLTDFVMHVVDFTLSFFLINVCGFFHTKRNY